jgi:hypothetical protein
MRDLIHIKRRPDWEARAGAEIRTDPAVWVVWAEYHEAMAHAGALLAGSGLKPAAGSWRVRSDARGRHIECSFTTSSELVAGYALLDVASGGEAWAWSRRFPKQARQGHVTEIDVRESLERDEFDLFEDARCLS